jgi:TrkA domain protein
MTDINEVKLPGVGVRYDFPTRSGRRVGVISHFSGRKEVIVGDIDDPDAAHRIVDLTEQEGHVLAEMLGGSKVVEHLAQLQQRVEGLAIDWLPLREGSPYVGGTIADARVRTRTGVSIVAVLRGEQAFPAPGPDFELDAGDYLVVIGTARGIESVVEILFGG